MQTPKAIELPKLPEMPDRVQLNRGIEQSGISIYGFTADQMNAHFLAGVEAGRAAASGQAGWVSVDDQLPTKYEDVWIVNFDDVQRAIWSDIDREFLVEDVHGAYERAFGVTHWMLSIIPAAPGASPSALVASPVEVQWTLTAPDGRQFQGDSPMRCAQAELDTRVPAKVQVARIWAAIDESRDELMWPLAQRAIDLHDKASMPWDQAYELALQEFGVDDDDLRELIGECGNGDDYLLNREAIEGFARAVLVWGPDYICQSPVAKIINAGASLAASPAVAGEAKVQP